MRTRMAAIGAAATVALVGCLVAPGTAAAAAASASCATSQLQQVPGGSASLAGSVPVVFIHGIISNAQMWEPTTPGSVAYQAARMSGITAWTFDYGAESLDWVTKNPAIGPAFARSLACLAHSSGHGVIVVAHSMGGLATQYALAQPDPDGGTVASHVAEVITVGTPYQGSELLTAMQLARLGNDLSLSPSAVLGEAVLSACAGHTSGICALPAVLPSQVGTTLELNSPAIASLPPWPAGLPVLDIAGDMGLLIGVGRFVLHRFDVGDVAVTVGSATGHNTTGGPVIKHCNSLKLLGAIYGNPGPCFHTRLVNDGDIITTILTAIRSAATAQTTGAFQGSWYVHDGSLCVGQKLILPASNPYIPGCAGATDSGWMRWWLGCGSYPGTAQPVCNGWAELTFSQGPGSTIIGTVNNVFYTTNNDAVIPGYDQSGSLQPGDTFELQHVATGLLKTTYLHTHLSQADLKYGNPYWCGPGISSANQFKCGA
jgi:triacylglycerol lipase